MLGLFVLFKTKGPRLLNRMTQTSWKYEASEETLVLMCSSGVSLPVQDTDESSLITHALFLSYKSSAVDDVLFIHTHTQKKHTHLLYIHV